MTLSVLLRTTDYRGDHAADVWVAHELRPGETVEALAARLKLDDDRYGGHGSNVIEIRRVLPAPSEAAA